MSQTVLSLSKSSTLLRTSGRKVLKVTQDLLEQQALKGHKGHKETPVRRVTLDHPETQGRPETQDLRATQGRKAIRAHKVTQESVYL